MAASNDISYALDLARSVFEICCEPPEEFSPGASAAQEIISVLEDFNRFKSSLESNPTNGEKEDFSLNKNLAPCIESLQKIESIRNKYNRRTSMGLSDKFRWRSDNDKFAKEILALLSVATVLQETVDLIKIMAERAQAAANAAAAQPKSPIREPAAPPPLPSTPKSSLPQPVTPTRVPVAITHVSIYNTPSTPTARIRTSPATRIPTRSPTQTRTPPRQGTTPEHSRTNPKGQLPLCPNGSGCRVPLCFQSHNHPPAKACDEGKDCPIPTCTRWHPQSRLCEIGPACPMTNCPRAHPWPRTTAAEGYLPSPVSPITGGGFEGRGPSDSVSSLDTNNNGPTIVTLISELGITSEADVELEAAVEPGPGPATSARTGAGTGFAAKCPKQYACPGGYNGECLLWHPRRQPCANGLLCRKGSRCTFDHSHLSNLPKSAPQYSELPAMGHRGGR